MNSKKAHDEVHKKFLTAWNDGFVTEASDARQIATTRAIFVITTNAATDALITLAAAHADRPDELRRLSVGALREAGFAPELLNRVDRIFIFNTLAGLDIAGGPQTLTGRTTSASLKTTMTCWCSA